MAHRIPPMPTIGDMIRMFQLTAKKQLAQNFLLDLNLTRKIVKSAGRMGGGRVCEVGPGPGGLTRAILEKGPAALTLVEKDGRFVKMLNGLKEAYPNGASRIRVEHTDVLRWDQEAMWGADGAGCSAWEDPPPNHHIIANLPFNIATPLFFTTGPWRAGRVKMTLTFQKEVGQRMIAKIDAYERCRLSAMTQMWTEPYFEFLIPGKSFVPPPEVDVAVMHFVPREEPLVRLPFQVVEKFCRHLFHYPNKYSIKPVMTLYPAALAGHMAHEVFRTARVDPTITCRQIGNEEIRDMAHVYYQQCRETPGLWAFDYRKPRPLEDGVFPPHYPFGDDDDAFTSAPQSLTGPSANTMSTLSESLLL